VFLVVPAAGLADDVIPGTVEGTQEKFTTILLKGLLFDPEK